MQRMVGVAQNQPKSESKFLSVTMLVVNMFLSLLFISGACAACDKDPDLGITAPQRMEALNGSCVQIPCNFHDKPGNMFDGRGEISGVWIKSDSRFALNPKNVVFNSSSSVNSYNISITGDLRQKNCTTLFPSVLMSFTDKYFFRVESKSLTSTAHCDPLQIIVKDSPPSPIIEIFGDLREKETITITCSALTPCPHSPPKLTWTFKDNSHNNMERNTDGTFSTKIQETIMLTDEHDGYNITCSATYPVNEGKDSKTAKETKTLSVPYSPRDILVMMSPSDPVSVGSMVNLTCSCRGSPPIVHFVWFMISDGRLALIKVDTQVYGFTVTKTDRERLFFCGCRNSLDFQLSVGHQLIFKGDDQFASLSVEALLKILGITSLISVLIIFECWWRPKGSIKPTKETEEPVYANRGEELELSPEMLLSNQYHQKKNRR